MIVSKVSNSESGPKITPGHRYWCNSTGHIRFPISHPLQLLSLSCTVFDITSYLAKSSLASAVQSYDWIAKI